MSRPLQFRMWTGSEMLKVDVLAISACGWSCPDHGKHGVSLAYQPHITVMQCIGLTDKNGIDVFEGDILQDGDRRVVVIWNQRDCKFALRWSLVVQYPAIRCVAFMTVVGNIHANPELMEANSA